MEYLLTWMVGLNQTTAFKSKLGAKQAGGIKIIELQ
jgi:hypothetical protein